jgi:Glu-tRNA(Gln) amidotransferase subunit E-like FAD-binding protein
MVSAGGEGIDTIVLLRKRVVDGENTGEFDTATEHDIFFLLV